jgi:hypothetical protein
VVEGIEDVALGKCAVVADGRARGSAPVARTADAASSISGYAGRRVRKATVVEQQYNDEDTLAHQQAIRLDPKKVALRRSQVITFRQPEFSLEFITTRARLYEGTDGIFICLLVL